MTKQEKSMIIEWMFLKDKTFQNVAEWREALVKLLTSMVEE